MYDSCSFKLCKKKVLKCLYILLCKSKNEPNMEKRGDLVVEVVRGGGKGGRVREREGGGG